MGTNWEFDFGHSQTGIGWEFVTFVQNCWKSTQNVSVRKMISEIIQTFWGKNGEVGNFSSEKSWKSSSYGWEIVGNEDLKSWEMVGNEDLKSWEMVGNLLISEVWESCIYIVMSYNGSKQHCNKENY